MAQAETILNDHTNIEAILLDLHLPDTNSERETLGRLEELRQTLPVIILTGMNDYAFAVKMVKATAAEFVDKALISTNPEIICDIVRFTVEQYRARQATDLSSPITEAG